MNNLGTATLAELVELLRREHPAWRLGQLISNVAGWLDAEVWDAEDDQLADAIRRHLADRRAARQTPEHAA